MAEIQAPADYFDEVATVGRYLDAISRWHTDRHIEETQFLSRVWFRGNPKLYPVPLRPGVYRDPFTGRAKRTYGGDDEEKRLNLEREMLEEFRVSGAAFFDANRIIDVYFLAQHYGMPTRLLDWTTNRLAGLFFAVNDEEDYAHDGEVFVMEAKGVLPRVAAGAAGKDVIQNVVGMRHPYVVDAIGQSFWHEPKKARDAIIIPLRPDNEPGRIGQQSSCFTLHMHKSYACTNPTLAKIKIPSRAKGDLLSELRRLNINEFTIYNDLDHLAKDIRRAWELR